MEPINLLLSLIVATIKFTFFFAIFLDCQQIAN